MASNPSRSEDVMVTTFPEFPDLMALTPRAVVMNASLPSAVRVFLVVLALYAGLRGM